MLSKHEEVFHQCCSYTECASQADLSLNVCSAPDNMVTPNETIIVTTQVSWNEGRIG